MPSPKVRDLGVIFDECLTLDAHISNICRRAHFHLRNIGRIRMLLSFEASSQLIHALITTTLDYCNGVVPGHYQHKHCHYCSNNHYSIPSVTYVYLFILDVE